MVWASTVVTRAYLRPHVESPDHLLFKTIFSVFTDGHSESYTRTIAAASTAKHLGINVSFLQL